MTYYEWCEIFSGNLRSLMESNDISAVQLADAIGISHPSVYGYLSKEGHIPSAVVILNIAYVLDCDVSDLIDFGDCVR